jgi:hypothetical protein
MVEIPLCIYFGYKINQLARQKDQNGVMWVVLTVFCFFLAYMFGMLLMMSLFYKGGNDVESLVKFFANPVRMLTLYLSGTGGYLMVRYILERRPDKADSNNDAAE